MLVTRCELCANLATKWRPCRCYERVEQDTGQFSLTCFVLIEQHLRLAFNILAKNNYLLHF